MNKDTKIIWKPIDDLIPYEHNAKEHNETQIKNLATSLEKYGWQNPILIDKDNVIVAGHGRVLGAKELGQTEVPCIYADDLTEEQVREYRILDNKLNESAWIDEELEFELPELDFSGFDLDFEREIPFDEKLLDNLFSDAPEKEKENKKVQCPACGEEFEI
jgi:ParB-like chromosome segregation protein Spo0J